MVEHEFCTWHISQNVKRVNRSNRVKDKKGRGKVQETIQTRFMVAAAAYTMDEFKQIYADLTKRYSTAHEYLENSVDVKKCARCYFIGSRNILTTNEAESINSTLRTAKTYLLLSLINAILMKISKWFIDPRKEVGEGSPSQCLTPTVENVLHARYQDSTYLKQKEINSTTCEYYVT